MSTRKAVVERYFDGFRRSDHAQILSCLTDDVVWEIKGFKTLRGKAEYDSEIENPAFVGSPTLDVEHVAEEGDVVMASGTGAGTQADGTEFRFAFAEVFAFSGDLVGRRESFVVPLSGESSLPGA